MRSDVPAGKQPNNGATNDEVIVGRAWAIDRIAKWLSGDDKPTFVLTGAPGTGKTSLMSQLSVMLDESDNLPRRASLIHAHYCDTNNERTLNPLDFIAALSNALAEKVEGFIGSLMTGVAGTSTTVTIDSSVTVTGDVHAGAEVTSVRVLIPRDLSTRQAFATLVRRPLEAVALDPDRTLVVIVDNVSGGYRFDSDDNIGRLVGTVADNPDELPPCLKFIVSTRPDPWVLKDLPPAALDLGDVAAGLDDVREYVRLRVARVPPRKQAAWIEQISRTAAGNFLYARHVCDDLLGNQDPNELPDVLELPSNLADLYQQWTTQHLLRNHKWWWDGLQPVLGCLAVACGDGLTLKEIAAVSRLSTGTARRAVEECHEFLSVSSRGRLRLYHHSFQEFLVKDLIDEEEWDRRIFDHFMEECRGNWLNASEYPSQHLCTHAVTLGVLPELIAEIAYLGVADPSVLLHHLSKFERELPPLALVYQRAGAALIAMNLPDRISYLELAAHELGQQAEASAFKSLPIHRSWTTLWVSLLQQRAAITLDSTSKGISDLAAGEVKGRKAIIALSILGNIAVYDASSMQHIHSVLEGLSRTPAERLCLWQNEGHAVIASSNPNSVVLYDIDDDNMLEQIADRWPAGVSALGAGKAAKRDLLAVGYSDGGLAAYDNQGTLVVPAVAAHDGPITAIASISHITATAGADGRLRIWTIDAQGWRPQATLHAGERWINDIAIVEDGEGYFVCVALSDGYVSIFNLLSNGFTYDIAELPVAEFTAHESAQGTVSVHASHPNSSNWERYTFPSGDFVDFATLLHEKEEAEDADLEVMDVQTGLRAGDDPDSSSADRDLGRSRILRLFGGANCVDAIQLNDKLLVASGGSDGSIKVFDPAAGTHTTLVSVGPSVSALKFARGSRGAALIAGELQGGTLRAWPLSPEGAPKLQSSLGDLEQKIVHAAHADWANGRNVIGVAFFDGMIVVRDIETGEELFRRQADADLLLEGIHLRAVGDDMVLMAYGSRDEEGQTVGAIAVWPRAQDLDTGPVNVLVDSLETVLSLGDLDGHYAITGVAYEGQSIVLLLQQEHGNWVTEQLTLQYLNGQNSDIPDWCRFEGIVDTAKGRFLVISAAPVMGRISLTESDGGVHETTLGLLPGAGVSSNIQPGSLNGELVVLGCDLVLNLQTFESDEQQIIEWFLNDSGYGDGYVDNVVAVAATSDFTVVVAAQEDGSLLIWGASEWPEHKIRLAWPAEQLLLVGASHLVVRSAAGLHCFALRGA